MDYEIVYETTIVKIKEKMKYKFIAFDLDGTLVNTFPYILSSYKYALTTVYGKAEESEESIKSKIGKPIAEFFIDYPEKDRKRLYDLYSTNNDAIQNNGVPFFTGVKELLKTLKEKVKVGLVTSKRRKPLEEWLEKENLQNFFDVVVAKEDTLLNKPNGQPLEKAMELAGVNATETLYVGDAKYDVMCAHNANVDACVVGWNAFGKEFFKKYKPEYYAESCQEIINLLKI